MNAEQVYALPIEKSTRELLCLRKFCDEIDYCFYNMNYDQDSSRIEIKTVKYVCTDGRRTYNLKTCWFDEKPVMIMQSAGRDDSEYMYRYITDLNLFKQMCIYILTLVNIDFTSAESDVIDSLTDKKELTFFYNQDHVSRGM